MIIDATKHALFLTLALTFSCVSCFISVYWLLLWFRAIKVSTPFIWTFAPTDWSIVGGSTIVITFIVFKTFWLLQEY